jgi:hypothetical protein
MRATERLVGLAFRSDGLLASPWPTLVAEVDDMGRAGLLSGPRRGLILVVFDRGLRAEGIDMVAGVLTDSDMRLAESFPAAWERFETCDLQLGIDCKGSLAGRQPGAG